MSASSVKPGSFLPRLLSSLRAFLLIPEPNDSDCWFDNIELAQLHTSTAMPTEACIDVQTWGDLLLEQYASLLSAGVSIFGQQVLHRRLRAGLDETACAAQMARVKALTADPEQLAALDRACQPLRRAQTEIADLLFGARTPKDEPAWSRYIGIVGPIFLASVALTFVWPLAWAAVGISFATLLAIRSRYTRAVGQWDMSLASLQQLLGVGSALGARSEPMLRPFLRLHARAGQISRSLSRTPLLALIPGAKDYLDWFMLDNVRHYFKSVARVQADIDYLRECYLLIANLEADIALARHLLATPGVCWAERHAGIDIALEQVVHPLLARAAPLSIALAGKGAFISGQNGIGKSTLLRTIGLNLVVARAFGFCYARSAVVPTRPVYASIQNEDSLLGGESLYMAELRRARELLASADGPHPGIYIVDEIFRGTNHLESVSAAAAVLDALAAKGVVIVSSHNLVLAPLLEHCLTPLYMRAPGGDPSRLALEPGVLAHTNGISLLSERGFDTRVQESAGKVFDWLSGYLAHPADCGHLLATPRCGN
ncbi:MAG: hypothetical protein JWP34_1755 [Massilia sp.]|nr:hypothetical protein [Massilia sp.]